MDLQNQCKCHDEPGRPPGFCRFRAQGLGSLRHGSVSLDSGWLATISDSEFRLEATDGEVAEVVALSVQSWVCAVLWFVPSIVRSIHSPTADVEANHPRLP